MNVIQFEIVGEAMPAGSKASYPVLTKGGDVVRTKTGRILTRVKHDNPKTEVWMGLVGRTAREVYGDGPLLNGPLRLTIMFYRARPQGHFGTGRNAGKLKASAPKYPTGRPDTVKLTRAVEDALTKVIWTDDSRVVSHVLDKRYDTYFHVLVRIEEMTEA